MKRSILASFSVLTPFVAMAADLPSRATGPLLVPIAVQHAWAGLYIGMNAGYGWSDVKIQERAPNLLPLTFTPDFVPQGTIGGLHAGYNFQNGKFVLGAEIDGSLTGIRARGSAPTQIAGLSYSLEGNLKWLVTGRVRIGYDMGAFLPYVTGGLALGKVNRTFSNSVPQIFSSSEVHTGWVLGLGSEYAFTKTVMGRIEANYINLGKKQYGTFSPSDVTPSGFIIRAGLSYKFGATSRAVIATY